MINWIFLYILSKYFSSHAFFITRFFQQRHQTHTRCLTTCSHHLDPHPGDLELHSRHLEPHSRSLNLPKKKLTIKRFAFRNPSTLLLHGSMITLCGSNEEGFLTVITTTQSVPTITDDQWALTYSKRISWSWSVSSVIAVNDSKI